MSVIKIELRICVFGAFQTVHVCSLRRMGFWLNDSGTIDKQLVVEEAYPSVNSESQSARFLVRHKLRLCHMSPSFTPKKVQFRGLADCIDLTPPRTQDLPCISLRVVRSRHWYFHCQEIRLLLRCLLSLNRRQWIVHT